MIIGENVQLLNTHLDWNHGFLISIVLPGISIGSNCIVGAGSIVTKDVPDNSVVAGNPAHFICSTSDYILKNKKMMETKPVYHKAWELSESEKAVAKEQIILHDGDMIYKQYAKLMRIDD